MWTQKRSWLLCWSSGKGNSTAAHKTWLTFLQSKCVSDFLCFMMLKVMLNLLMCGNFQNIWACWKGDRGVPQSRPRPVWWSASWYGEEKNTNNCSKTSLKFRPCFCIFPFWPPGRADPECMLGHLLKILFKNDDFMNTVRMDEQMYSFFLVKVKAYSIVYSEDHFKTSVF